MQIIMRSHYFRQVLSRTIRQPRKTVLGELQHLADNVFVPTSAEEQKLVKPSYGDLSPLLVAMGFDLKSEEDSSVFYNALVEYLSALEKSHFISSTTPLEEDSLTFKSLFTVNNVEIDMGMADSGAACQARRCESNTLLTIYSNEVRFINDVYLFIIARSPIKI